MAVTGMLLSCGRAGLLKKHLMDAIGCEEPTEACAVMLGRE